MTDEHIDPVSVVDHDPKVSRTLARIEDSSKARERITLMLIVGLLGSGVGTVMAAAAVPTTTDYGYFTTHSGNETVFWLGLFVGGVSSLFFTLGFLAKAVALGVRAGRH